MAAFLENLWESIFTPGPTPTLLLATNVAFGALQLLLLGLLVATFSIHFVVLSFLCGGLWISINWFAKEVSALQASEEERKRAEASGNVEKSSQTRSRAGADDSGDDTADEKENRPPGGTSTTTRSMGTGARGSGNVPGAAANTSVTTGLAPPAADDAARQRRSLAESTGDLSTDSEWEKVDDE